MQQFESKFKSKTGLSWADRGADPKSNKYTFLERNYAPDTDEDGDDSKEVKTEDPDPVESTLAPPVQVRHIFEANGLLHTFFYHRYLRAD
jgi:poly [ADP-ribose] polymerase